MLHNIYLVFTIVMEVKILVNDGHLVAFGTAENDFDDVGWRTTRPRHIARIGHDVRRAVVDNRLMSITPHEPF